MMMHLICHVLLLMAADHEAPAAGQLLQWSECDVNSTARHRNPHHHQVSQQAEDVMIVRDLFCDACTREVRKYVEIGALDGHMFSNTLLLEKLGWEGLLIEGQPTNAQALMRNRGRTGKNVIIPEAVCAPPGVVNFVGGGHTGTAGVASTMNADYYAYWRHR